MNDLKLELSNLIIMMKDVGYSTQSTVRTEGIVSRYIEFISKQNLKPTVESCEQFISYELLTNTRFRNKEYFSSCARLCIHRFIRYVDDKKVGYFKDTIKHSFSGDIGGNITSFLITRKEILSQATYRDYESKLFSFYTYLVENDIHQLDSKVVIDFFNEYCKDYYMHSHSIYTMYIVLGKYFTFLFENGLIDSNLKEVLPKVKYRRPVDLPSVYSNEEIEMIMNTIDRNSTIGKRNYAMISLAVYLGLRAGDIVSLKLDEIDWERNIIHLEMNKTNKSIKLPLLPEVGNAILDYLQYARRKCKLDYVFITDKGNIRKISSAALYGVVSSTIKKSGIDISNRNTGPHSLRHSLATRLLKKNESLPVISEVLGHSDTNVTTVYTSIDYASLKMCALEVPPLNSNIYEEVNNYATKSK